MAEEDLPPRPRCVPERCPEADKHPCDHMHSYGYSHMLEAIGSRLEAIANKIVNQSEDHISNMMETHRDRPANQVYNGIYLGME